MKKYKTLFVIIFVLLVNSIYSQSWQWAKSAGGGNWDAASTILSDQSGNIYFSVNAELPICYFQNDTFNINGFNDFFIVKYDALGNEVWVKQFGGANTNMMNIQSEAIADLKIDHAANCLYVTGLFFQSCSFGSITLGNGSPNLQLFLAKFDLNGNCIWAKQGGNVDHNDATKLAIDPSGNIYLEGSCTYSVAFDTLTIQPGGYIAKFDSSGNGLWSKKIFSNHFGANPAYGVKTFQYLDNDLYMLGFRPDSVTIDTVAFSNKSFIAQILTRWDTLGNIKWSRELGGPSLASLGSMSFDGLGNFYCIGTYNGTYAVFGTDSLHSTDPVNGFIVKYDISGTKLWLKQINTTQNLYALGNYSDGDGNFYITGSFNGSASFGSYNVNSATTEDMFIARYNGSGDCLGVRHTGEARTYDVLSDVNGDAFVTGEFKNTTSFGVYSLTSHGNSDMFIAKISAFTGIGGLEKTTNNQLLIYANPTGGKCNITIPDEFKNDKNLTLSIYDNSGKLLQQTKVQMLQDKVKLDLEQEAKGVYNVTLSNGKKSYNGKVVFE